MQGPVFPKINTSEGKLLPPLTIVDKSEDGKLYNIENFTPKGKATIPMKTAWFTPQSDGNLIVFKADVVDILE
jgi:hypothetical protein